MLRRAWRRIRPYALWIVLIAPAWLLGGLLVGTAWGDADGDTEMALAGAILIGTTLPWIAIRAGLPGLWRNIRFFPLAIGLAIPGALFGTLFLSLALDSGDEPILTGVALFLIAAPLVWCLIRAGRLWRARRRMVRDLRSVVVGGPAIDSTAFADVPFFIADKRFYYALNNVLMYQELDRLVWAYGERGGWYWCQLAVWNREAGAVVLPLHAQTVPEALRRLRAAAPWLATGFNRALTDSWNLDHAEFLALIERHRVSGQPFAPAWAAGSEIVPVLPRTGGDSQVDSGVGARREQREIEKALKLWSGAAAG